MRLVDLLLVLLFEGRKALLRAGPSGVQLLTRMRRGEAVGDKCHRQLIDCIRSKDTDALIEAIEHGGMYHLFLNYGYKNTRNRIVPRIHPWGTPTYFSGFLFVSLISSTQIEP